MQQNSINLNKSEILFMNSLLRDGHKNDAELSRETGLSKATIGRIRKKLEDTKILNDYIPVIDLNLFGVQLFSVVLFEWSNFSNKNATLKMKQDFQSTPQVVYFAEGEGPENVNYVAVLGFFNIEGCHAFFNELRSKYEKSLGKMTTFFIPSRKIIKQDFTGLAKLAIEKKWRNLKWIEKR